MLALDANRTRSDPTGRIALERRAQPCDLDALSACLVRADEPWPGGGCPHFASIVLGRVPRMSDETSDDSTIRRVDDSTTTELDDDQLDALAAAQREMNEARARLSEIPAEVVITNHVMGLYELAAIHLSATPPDLRQSALAIDAVALPRRRARRPARRGRTDDAATRWPTSAWRSCRSRARSTRRRAEPTDRRVGHTSAVDHDAPSARSSSRLLSARITGDEPAGGVDHPPPRHVDVGGREDAADQASLPRVAGDLGDVAVASSPRPARSAISDVEDPTFAVDRSVTGSVVAHGRMLAASHRPSLASRSNVTSAPTSIVRDPSAISMQWNGMAARRRRHRSCPRPDCSSNAVTTARRPVPRSSSVTA